jgi:ATP-dependent NAD(P)H-hydrate dehydratase
MKIIPPLISSLHKGEAGRICVIGGCKEYTGAPYYASVSALKTGCDLSWVICSSQATLIKAYTPEIMVNPLLSEDTPLAESTKNQVLEEFEKMTSRIHVLIIGPGLGRNESLLELAKGMVQVAKKKNMPLVFDGDGLYMISQNLDLIKGYKRAVLTPNPNEFKKLYEVVFSKKEIEEHGDDEESQMKMVGELCDRLGNITVVRKGQKDFICNGSGKENENYLVHDDEGSPRRCGGQGDLLSGAMGTFLHWAIRAAEKDEKKELSEQKAILYGAYGACMLTKRCAKAAFEKHKRGMTTPDMIEQISSVFEELWPYAKL